LSFLRTTSKERKTVWNQRFRGPPDRSSRGGLGLRPHGRRGEGAGCGAAGGEGSRDPGPLDVGRIFDTGIANHQQPTTQGEPKRSSSASRQSSSFRFAKRGTLRSRVITASLSVICVMVVKIDPTIDSSPRILPLLSAICSRYWCLAGSAACPIAEGGSHCAIRVSQIPKISKVSANFFLQHPIVLYGRETPPGKTRPPSRFAANKKHAFFNTWPAAGFLFAARETTLGQLNGLKGPRATPPPNHATTELEM
jgi:hypothetical protein